MKKERWIDENDLLHILTLKKTTDACGGHQDFYAWNRGSKELEKRLEKVGELCLSPGEKQESLNYWGEDAPIWLDQYPYHHCEVFRCTQCQTLFFHYLEQGGHAPQKRYRVIRKELIDLGEHPTS